MAGKDDEQMMALVAKHNMYYCIMHMQGSPKNMQDNPSYKDVVSEISTFLNSQANKAIKLGINQRKNYIRSRYWFWKKSST